LVDLYKAFAAALREAIAQVILLPGVTKACISRKERLLEAVARGDGEAASVIALQYIDWVSPLISEFLHAPVPAAHEREHDRPEAGHADRVTPSAPSRRA